MDLKVMSLNCWDLPLVSRLRKERILAISTELARSDYDIVALQEVWLQKDFEFIKHRVQTVLPHAHYFCSGVFGSGLCLFSKYSFEHVYYHQWAMNGYIHKIHHGDWFGGKGVGMANMIVNETRVTIYCTHLHAEYDRNNDEYLAHRILQAYDTAQFIRLTSKMSDMVILAGDLNTEPGDIPYRLIINVGQLCDTFYDAIKRDPEVCETNLCEYNTFSPSPNKNIPAVRIDYIMYKKYTPSTETVVAEYSHPFPRLVPDGGYSYSDHEAICSTLRLQKNLERNIDCDTNYEIVLKESIDSFNKALEKLKQAKTYYYCFALIFVTGLLIIEDSALPFGLTILFRLVGSGGFFYNIVMATLWNMYEETAINASKKSMIIDLETLERMHNSKTKLA